MFMNLRIFIYVSICVYNKKMKKTIILRGNKDGGIGQVGGKGRENTVIVFYLFLFFSFFN